MKKPCLVVTGLLVSAALVSMNLSSAQDKQPGKEPKHNDYAYYPLKEGMRWVYQVSDNKAKDVQKKEQVVMTVAGRDAYVVKAKSKDPLRAETKEMYVGFKLHVSGGGKMLEEEVMVKEDGVYRISGAGKAITPPLCFLKAGIKKGEAWTVDSTSENAVLKGRFTLDQETVQVPAGSFDAIVARCSDFQVGGQSLKIDAWYAEKVGMVKQRVRIGQHDVTLELEKFDTAP